LLGVFAAGALLAGAWLFLTFRVVPVNEDAGTFVPIAKEVLHGAVPTKDVMTWKTPGMYYLAALWMKSFGPGFEAVVLLVYLVNVLNSLLLYLALSRFLPPRIPRLLLCLSFFYSVMVMEGFWIVLEPLQVTFILAAYLVWLRRGEGLLKYVLIGLLLGCSIMVKQYSVFVLAGFLAAIWLDRRREDRAAVLGKMTATALLAAVPFFCFVGLTGADTMNALRSFGGLGGISAAYASAGWAVPGSLGVGLLAGIVRANWLFLPFVAFPALFLRRRDYFGASLPAWGPVVLLFVFSAMPLLVRQFNHYFLLVAPWSYLLLGMMLGSVPERGELAGAGKGEMAGAVVCMFVVLPAFLAATPSFFLRPKAEVALFTLLFLLSVLSVLYAGHRISGRRLNMSAVVVGLCAAVFFETLFLGMKIPFREFGWQKEAQFAEAEEINRVFPKGSAVTVIGYHPYAYVTCDFVDPLHDYEFGNSAKQPEIDWDRTGSVLLGPDSAPAYRRELTAHGFRKIGELKSGIEFYERSSKVKAQR
jgi:hypothetical protein